MEAIFVLVLFDLVLLFISLFKKDSTLILFSGLFFIFTSLRIYRFGFGNLPQAYVIGSLIFGVGIYILVRTGLDMMVTKKKKEVK